MDEFNRQNQTLEDNVFNIQHHQHDVAPMKEMDVLDANVSSLPPRRSLTGSDLYEHVPSINM